MCAYPPYRDFERAARHRGEANAGNNGEAQSAEARPSPLKNGADHPPNGHPYTPDEIEALHESGKAAVAPAPRTRSILPKADFQAIVQANLQYLYLVQLDTALAALCDLDMEPSHRAVFSAAIRLMRVAAGGFCFPGPVHLSEETGLSTGTCSNALADLRALLGYFATAQFAVNPGEKARFVHTVVRPPAHLIRALIATVGTGDKYAQRAGIEAWYAAHPGEGSRQEKAEFTRNAGEGSQAAGFTHLDGEGSQTRDETTSPAFTHINGEDSEAKEKLPSPKQASAFTRESSQPIDIPQSDPHNKKGTGRSKKARRANATAGLFDDDATQEQQLGSKKQQRATLLDWLFPAFVKAYPRRAHGQPDPTQAVDAIKRELGRLVGQGHVTPQALLAGTERFARDPGKFIPNAENWLRDGRWRGHVEAAANPTTAKPAPALDPSKMSDAAWKPYIQAFFETGAWRDDLGPKPREEGCLAPERWVRHFEALTGASR